METQPLLIIPELACEIGLNEAVVLQQIHYWVEINKAANRNFYDGHYWTYNTYDQWQLQFPFWSKSTIVRTISNIEKGNNKYNLKFILVGNFNKLKIDKTKWYTVDYNALQGLPFSQFDKMDYSKRIDHNSNLDKAIPENTIIDLHSKDFKLENDKGRDSRDAEKKNYGLGQRFDSKNINEFIGFYINEMYPHYLGKKHPHLKSSQLKRIYGELEKFCVEYDIDDYCTLEDMANKFFRIQMNTDYNLNHFATEGILTNRYYEILY